MSITNPDHDPSFFPKSAKRQTIQDGSTTIELLTFHAAELAKYIQEARLEDLDRIVESADIPGEELAWFHAMIKEIAAIRK